MKKLMKRIWCYLFHMKIKKWNQRLLTFNEEEDEGAPVFDIIVYICPKCGCVSWASEQIKDICHYDHFKPGNDEWSVPE